MQVYRFLKLSKSLVAFVTAFIFGCMATLAQTNTLTGTVTDKSGEPLIGATILVKGTNIGTSTDIDGKYTLNARPGQTVQVSYVGYKPVTIKLKNDGVLNVVMEDDTQVLNEVVVTAMGITREAKSLSYARQSIDTDNMTEVRGTNLLDMLSGKASGMQIISGGGPTASTRVVIRGINSLTGNNQPLFVIDGVPMLNNSGEDGDLDYGNAANSINPDEIENIEVLKGANASALYGSDAANGVILITTKKAAKENKGLGVTYNFNMMFGHLYDYPTYQNIYGAGQGGMFQRRSEGTNYYGAANNNVFFDPNLPYFIWNPNQAGQNQRSWGMPMLGFDVVGRNGEVKSYSPHPETIENMYQTSTMITNNVAVEKNFTGGSFRFSYNNVHSDDILAGVNKLNRHTFNLRGTADLAKWVNINVNGRYQYEKVNNRAYRNASDRNPVYMIAQLPRDASVSELIPWKKEDGTAFVFKDFNNPFWLLNETSNSDSKNWFLGNVTLTFKVTDFLKIQGRAATDVQHSEGWNFINMYAPFDQDGEYSYWKKNWTNNNFDALVMFNKNFFDQKFNLNANVGTSYQEIQGSKIKSLVNTLQFPDIKSLSNNKGLMASIQENEWKKKQAVYGMASMGWDNWAFLDLTARNEWSSTLPKNNNSYFYWSAGTGIILSSLFKMDPHAFPFIKIRGSYAQVGNDTGYDRLVSGYYKDEKYYVFNGIPYYTGENTLKTMGLKPEQTRSWEIGAELKFLDNRISLDATYYNKVTRDQIVTADAPLASGYQWEILNAGKMKNQGVELSLTARPLQFRNFTWSTTINWSKNKNEVIELSEGVRRFQIGEAQFIKLYAEAGKPYGVFYGNDYKRDEDGNILVGIDGKPKYVEDQYLGNVQPDWFGGWSNTFRIFDFDLGFAIDFQKGGKVWSYTAYEGARNGQTVQTLDGRLDYFMSAFILGEDKIERQGFLDPQYTNDPNASMYSHLYPDGSRPKGIYVPGVYDSDAGDMAGKPTVVWTDPQDYWVHNYQANTSRFIYDASYIKLREISVGYNVPEKWVRKTKFFRTARISFVGRNVAILYQNTPKGIDPQATSTTGNAQGFERGFTLPMATYGFDIKVTF